MTTPGLDVLEIKRSNNVSHYTHLTHAPGCVSGYKSYALDYFDSVLIGGKGDIEVISYLETLRNLPTKEVEVIGHTYIDVYREQLEEQEFEYSLFDVKRPTILISPTWSNHGLLMRYGHELLANIEAEDKYNVIIRPHPQSMLSEKDMIDDLMKRFPNNDSRIWNTDTENLKAMSHADIMISDFSGIIFDFFILFNRPILTMRSQYEKRGRDSIDLLEDPWDIQVLSQLGGTIGEEDIANLPAIISETLVKYGENNVIPVEAVELFNMNPGESGILGTNFIEKTLLQIQESKVNLVQTKEDFIDNSLFTGEVAETSNSFIKNTLSSLLNPMMGIQISIGIALLITYTLLGLTVFPVEGLNYEYFSKLLPYLAYGFAASLVFVVVLLKINKMDAIRLALKPQKIRFKDFLLILLPLTPILVYVFSNQDILTVSSSLYVLGYFSLIALAMIILIPWILSPILSKSINISLSIGFLYTVFSMASYGRSTSMKLITLIFVFISVVVFFFQFYKQQSILVVISLLLFIGNGTVSFMDVKAKEKLANEEAGETKVEEDPNSTSLIELLTEGKVVQKTPDVYFLIYDSYANQETMDHYGFDNSDQIKYLLKNDFTIYDGTYSLGASSLISMSQMFHPEPLNHDNGVYRSKLAGSSSSFKSFKSNGYQMNSIQDSDYMTRGITPKYDFSFPDDKDSIDPHSIIINAIIEGEFRFDAEFSNTNYDDYVYAKELILKKKTKEPKLVKSIILCKMLQ